MKHPKYRVADILRMDKTVRQELFNFVLTTVETYLPREVLDVWMVGSYTFGNADLHSDFDFNLVCQDKVIQQWVKSNWTIENKQAFKKCLVDWQRENGIRIDYYFHDCITDTDEIYLSLNENKLYNRDDVVIDLNNIVKIPKAKNQHLTFNPLINKWVSSVPIKKSGSWGKDEFVDEIPEWSKKYGADFIKYKKINGVLKQS